MAGDPRCVRSGIRPSPRSHSMPSSRRLAIPLLAALALAAPPSALAHGHGPDARIFATDNTAVITDPADPRLDDPLTGFARDVERIVAKGGGSPRGSQLLDGVFFSSDLGTTTFERSREFDVDHVADDELHAIADTVRDRFDQESVLTFDNLRPGDTQSPSGSGTFVEGPAPVRIERRALLVAGTAQDDSATLRERHGRVSVALGDQELDFDRRRFDRIRVDLGDGLDTLAVDGLNERVRASAAAGRVKVAGVELQNVDNLRI